MRRLLLKKSKWIWRGVRVCAHCSFIHCLSLLNYFVKISQTKRIDAILFFYFAFQLVLRPSKIHIIWQWKNLISSTFRALQDISLCHFCLSLLFTSHALISHSIFLSRFQYDGCFFFNEITQVEFDIKMTTMILNWIELNCSFESSLIFELETCAHFSMPNQIKYLTTHLLTPVLLSFYIFFHSVLKCNGIWADLWNIQFLWHQRLLFFTFINVWIINLDVNIKFVFIGRVFVRLNEWIWNEHIIAFLIVWYVKFEPIFGWPRKLSHQ